MPPTEDIAGRYRVIGPAGKGAMAKVYLAEDLKRGGRVAVKILLEDYARTRDGRARFAREARAALSIEHPNVVRVLGYGERELAGPFLVMEALEGETLGDYLRRHTRMDPALCCALLEQAALGLQASHESCVVHRDVKPDNLFLVGPPGAPRGLKVLDFGLARIQDEKRITAVGQVAGTAAYMAPERAVGEEADARTDVYSLGVVMYAALVGRLPFDAPSPQILLAHQIFARTHKPSGVVPGLDARHDRILASAMRKNPANRYASMQALAEDLRRARDPSLGEPLGAPVVSRPDAFEPQTGLGRTTALLFEEVFQRSEPPHPLSTAGAAGPVLHAKRPPRRPSTRPAQRAPNERRPRRRAARFDRFRESLEPRHGVVRFWRARSSARFRAPNAAPPVRGACHAGSLGTRAHCLAVSIVALAALGCSAGSNTRGGAGTGGGGGAGAGTTFTNTGAAGAGGAEGPACEGSSQQTTSGCDYYALMPDISSDAAGGCYAAFVVNPWDIAVTLDVAYDGQSLDPSTFGFIPSGAGASMQYAPLSGGVLPPGQVAILFLNRFGFSPLGLNTDCPPGIVPAISTFDAAPHGTGIGKAFHIQSSARVVAYDIYPYGGGQSALTSATLLLPTTSWGDNYVAVTAFGDGAGFGTFGSFPVVSVVAHQPNTVVIKPKFAIDGGNGVAGTAAGVSQSYTLQPGQVLQFTQPKALDGSIIQANAPVGVWGGKTTLGIEACCDDSGHQQIPPVRALGSEYVGVRYRNRYAGTEETPPWRIIGATDGTALVWEPSTPAGAPTSLALGQVAQFNAAGPFVVRSQDAQHPFYVAAHMTGAGLYDPDPQGNGDGRGDAEFVNVIPPGEFLTRYVFFTDPTYPETNLVLTRMKGPNGFADVNLDCAGVLSGWAPLGSSGTYEYAYVDLVKGKLPPQGSCDNGRHEITSDRPFGLTVWGWGSAATGSALSGFYTQYVSYAYPGGASVAAINDVVIPVIN